MSKDKRETGLSAFGVVAILIMVGLLGWAGWYAAHAWNAMRGVAISPLGWLFMALAAIVTFLLGAGLMALVFYSSRHDMDR
jgi:TRAP-type C4-dicarboxylate transport system permease small subunit